VRAIKLGNPELARQRAEEHLANTARRSLNIDLRSVNYGVERLLDPEETKSLQQATVPGAKTKKRLPMRRRKILLSK
jgi:hypothetical protein